MEDEDFDLPPPPGASSSRATVIPDNDPFAARAKAFREAAQGTAMQLAHIDPKKEPEAAAAPKFNAAAYTFKPLRSEDSGAGAGAKSPASPKVAAAAAGPSSPRLAAAKLEHKSEPPKQEQPKPEPKPVVVIKPAAKHDDEPDLPPPPAAVKSSPASKQASPAAAPPPPAEDDLPPPPEEADAEPILPAKAVVAKKVVKAQHDEHAKAEVKAAPAVSAVSVAPPASAPSSGPVHVSGESATSGSKFGVLRPPAFVLARAKQGGAEEVQKQVAFAGIGAAVAALAAQRPVNPQLTSPQPQVAPQTQQHQQQQVHQEEDHKPRRTRNPKAHSNEDRQKTLGWLQELQLFNPPAEGQEFIVNGPDLDKVLDEGRTTLDTQMYLAYLSYAGRKFDSFDDLADAMEEARAAIESEKLRVKKALGSDWNESQINRLFVEGRGGPNTLSFLQQFVKMPTGTKQIDTIIHNLQVLSDKEKQEGKMSIIQYLQAADCSLFTVPIQVRQSDISKLSAAAGGYANALSDLRCLDALNQRFQSFQELLPALKSPVLQNYKRDVLNILLRYRNKIFEDPIGVPITLDSVTQLLAISGMSGPALKDSIELLSEFPEKFHSIRDLAEHMRGYAQERSDNLIKEIDSAFSLLGTLPLFKKQVSVTNSDMKNLVLACFGHYSLVGGPVKPVLQKLVAQKLKFESFEDLIDAAGSPSGDPSVPLPPSKEKEAAEKGWTWHRQE